MRILLATASTSLKYFFYTGKIIKSRKLELNLAVRRKYMPKNRYAMNYTIFT